MSNTAYLCKLLGGGAWPPMPPPPIPTALVVTPSFRKQLLFFINLIAYIPKKVAYLFL